MRLSPLTLVVASSLLAACGSSTGSFDPGDTTGGGVTAGGGSHTGSSSGGSTSSSSGSTGGGTHAPGPNTLSGPLAFNVVYAGGQAHYASGTINGSGYTSLSLFFTDTSINGCGFTGAAAPSQGVHHDFELTLYPPFGSGLFIAPMGYGVPNDQIHGYADIDFDGITGARGQIGLETFSFPTDGGAFIEASGDITLQLDLSDGGTSNLTGNFDVGNCP